MKREGNVRLRQAVAADAECVAEVLIRSRAARLPDTPFAHSELEVAAWVADLLIPAGGVTVAALDGAVVGVMALSQHDGAGWIDQMYVVPERIGRGIGTLLLAHALAVLVPPVRLYTFQANEGARRFYERHGFVAIEFSDGRNNEERCPDVLYELRAAR